MSAAVVIAWRPGFNNGNRLSDIARCFDVQVHDGILHIWMDPTRSSVQCIPLSGLEQFTIYDRPDEPQDTP